MLHYMLIKGDKVVQLTIGSNVVINSTAITMDVAAEISNDRTMLPFRWVAQALGAKVSWDEAAQTLKTFYLQLWKFHVQIPEHICF